MALRCNWGSRWPWLCHPAGRELLPALHIHQPLPKGGEHSPSRCRGEQALLPGSPKKPLTATGVLPHPWKPPSSPKVKVLIKTPLLPWGLVVAALRGLEKLEFKSASSNTSRETLLLPALPAPVAPLCCCASGTAQGLAPGGSQWMKSCG